MPEHTKVGHMKPKRNHGLMPEIILHASFLSKQVAIDVKVAVVDDAKNPGDLCLTAPFSFEHAPSMIRLYLIDRPVRHVAQAHRLIISMKKNLKSLVKSFCGNGREETGQIL